MFFAKVIKPTYLVYICAIPKSNEIGAQNPYKSFVYNGIRCFDVELQHYAHGA